MLQGSLENFALDEVLGLLSGTSKTGQLEIAGNRGTGTLLFDTGRLVDGTASYTANGTELEDVMFELLRYDDGTFTFNNREVSPSDHPENVASVLAAAENRLRDWRSIEAVVPTLNHQVVPSSDLPSDEVTITRAEWAALTVIAAGCPVSLVCDRLDLGEVEGSRCVKNLAERELVVVSEPIGGFAATYRSTESINSEPPAPPPFETVVAAAAPPMPPIEAATDLAGGNGVAPASTDEPAAAAAETEPASSSALGSLLGGQRPPMPPIPAPEQLQTDGVAADQLPADTPPAPTPPSPAEISSFGEELENASELVGSGADDGKGGGLLARYLKGDD